MEFLGVFGRTLLETNLMHQMPVVACPLLFVDGVDGGLLAQEPDEVGHLTGLL